MTETIERSRETLSFRRKATFFAGGVVLSAGTFLFGLGLGEMLAAVGIDTLAAFGLFLWGSAVTALLILFGTVTQTLSNFPRRLTAIDPLRRASYRGPLVVTSPGVSTVLVGMAHGHDWCVLLGIGILLIAAGMAMRTDATHLRKAALSTPGVSDARA